MIFKDRREAGRALGQALLKYRQRCPIVFGLPRGGVVVAYEVACALGAPLDVMVTRKLGTPGNPEFGFGAVGPGGVRVIDERTVRMLRLSPDQIAAVAATETEELDRRLRHYRGDRPMPDLSECAAIVVDDGLATGGTARAAVQAVRALEPQTLVLAVPVSPPDTVKSFHTEVDEVVCLHTPVGFTAVGQWYQNFAQTSDAEVVELLELARRETGPDAPGQ